MADIHTPRRARSAAIILSAASLPAAMSGCGRDASPTHALRVDTLASGLVHVTNGDPGAAAALWHLEEDLRLGSGATGESAEQFGDIYALIADGEGRIYILDAQAQEVRVFGAEGAFSHTIGRKGDGPGELSNAGGLNIGPDGRLWVWDPSLGYTVFDLDGTFVTRHRRLVYGVLYPWRGGFGPDGRMYDWGISYPGMEENRVAPRAIYHPFRASDDFSALDTLPTFSFERELDGQRQVPFAAVLSIYQDGNATVWFAHQREYMVRRRTMEGDTTLAFSLPAVPAPVTQADRDEVFARQSDLPQQFHVPEEAIPATKPIIRRIFGDDAGHVYVIPELEGVAAGSVVDAFDTNGVFLARMRVPTGRIAVPMPAPFATSDHLYVVMTDQLDIPYVARLRIVRPDAPSSVGP